MASSSNDDVTKRAQEMYRESFMDARSCRTTFTGQVITPTAKLYGKDDLRRFGDSNRCEVSGFGYSRLYAMPSAVYRKRP